MALNPVKIQLITALKKFYESGPVFFKITVLAFLWVLLEGCGLGWVINRIMNRIARDPTVPRPDGPTVRR
jgi:hypothetical protein